jgi:hypothetical protein
MQAPPPPYTPLAPAYAWVGPSINRWHLPTHPRLPRRSDIDRLSSEEATLAAALEREGMANPAVLHVLNALSRRIRPSQLTIHRRLLKAHLDGLEAVITDVAATALKTTRPGAADAAAVGLEEGCASAAARAAGAFRR